MIQYLYFHECKCKYHIDEKQKKVSSISLLNIYAYRNLSLTDYPLSVGPYGEFSFPFKKKK